jgi:hypothetical protein
MYIYFNVIYFASVAKICRLEFGLVPTVWYICFLLFYFIVFEDTKWVIRVIKSKKNRQYKSIRTKRQTKDDIEN